MPRDVFAEVQHLGAMIRELREGRTMSVNDLAVATGLSTSVISKFERGQTDVHLSTAIQLLSYMGLTLEDVYLANIFNGFSMIDWAEKAYRFADNRQVLERILTELEAKKHLLQHEQALADILLLLLGEQTKCTENLVDYFENLDSVLSFDAYLALLAKPYLPTWLIQHIGKRLGNEASQRSPIVQIAWEHYHQTAF
ncbi:Transcriptional regulator, contains XRE-family HTH domain [Fructobacillus pseudoficulneus]|nr:Transcriptional regulator, contains XRE-family HTH domain [Fructobacillus pseudoficulneus]